MRISDKWRRRLSAPVRLILELLLLGGCVYLVLHYLEGKGPILRESLRWIFG